METQKGQDGNIHIGLVMAGAVSAGAFTGGVIDYLLNTLELWQKEYEKNPVATPKPNVVIDTITGASAGSIAAAISLISVATNRFKMLEPGNITETTQNLQYHAWVNYGLGPNESALDQLFSDSDLTEGKLYSLLNTNFIDALVENIKNILSKSDIRDLPKYLNPNIELLMTLSNLRGIPIDLYFSNDSKKAAHSMSYHKAFAYFKYDKFDDENSTFSLNLNNDVDIDLLLNCAKASGAFPIGLKSVKFENISNLYIKSNLQQIFGDDIYLEPRIGDTYEFLAVDGGMTNNEPIAEALQILQKGKAQNIPVIMIDPFPNYLETRSKEKRGYDLNKDTILDVIPQLYTTLRNQVLFKEKDITRLFNKESIYKMIWPTRHNENNEALANALATGALGGFSGFFDKKFREHDYFLGMKNCQNFLRYYFSQTPEESGWTDEQIERFSIVDADGKKKVPIIPDLRITGRNEDGKEFLPKIEGHDNFPKFPQVSHDELVNKKLKRLIKKRVRRIVDILLSEMFKPQENNGNAFPRYTKRKKFSIGNLVPNSWKRGLLKRVIVRQLVPTILDGITDAFAAHDLFRDNKNRPDTRLERGDADSDSSLEEMASGSIKA